MIGPVSRKHVRKTKDPDRLKRWSSEPWAFLPLPNVPMMVYFTVFGFWENAVNKMDREMNRKISVVIKKKSKMFFSPDAVRCDIFQCVRAPGIDSSEEHARHYQTNLATGMEAITPSP